MASQSGDSIYQIGLLWIMLEMTGSESATGLVAMASYLPAVLFSLFAGVIADRHDKRRIMLISDAVRVLIVLTIPLMMLGGAISPLYLGINAFAIAIAATFFNPSRDSLIPQLVPQTGLVRANSLIQTSWQFSLLFGPTVAGLILHYGSQMSLFWAAAWTYAISFGLVLAMKTKATPPTPPSIEGGDKDRASVEGDTVKGVGHVADILSGLKYVFRHKVIGPLLLITIADNIFIMGPAIVGTPVFIREELHLGGGSYALIQGCYAVGMLIGTALLLTFGGKLGKGKVLLWGMVLDGVTFIPLYWINTLWAMELTIIVHSLAIPILTVSRASLIQDQVEPAYRGRVFALVNLAVVGMSAISSGMAGVALEAFGARSLFLAIGIGGGLCGVIGWIVARRLRESK